MGISARTWKEYPQELLDISISSCINYLINFSKGFEKTLVGRNFLEQSLRTPRIFYEGILREIIVKTSDVNPQGILKRTYEECFFRNFYRNTSKEDPA